MLIYYVCEFGHKILNENMQTLAQSIVSHQSTGLLDIGTVNSVKIAVFRFNPNISH